MIFSYKTYMREFRYILNVIENTLISVDNQALYE